MHRRHTTRRILEVGALAVLLFLTIGALVAYFVFDAPNDPPALATRSGNDRPSPAPSAVNPAAPPTEAALPVPPVEEPTAAATAQPAKPERSRPVARLRKRKVIFTPSPLAVTISIDGQAAYPYGPGTRSKQLAVGSHEIEFIPKDETRYMAGSWKVKIPDGKEPYQFRRRLKWRPAQVQVTSNVQTIVTIPARTTGKTNALFPVDIRNGPEEEVAILISAPGYAALSKRVKIRAGETTQVTMDLKAATK